MSEPGTSEDVAAVYRASEEALQLARAAYERTVRSIVGTQVSDLIVSSRVKDIRSLVVKARGGASGRTWESITDKIGIRVVASTKSDVRAVDKAILSGPWQILEREVKTGDPNELYYAGTHFLVDSGHFKDSCDHPLVAEIQIRTRAQDAWSVVSHKLLYKGLVVPPARMRRVVARLTVLMEMFDDDVHRMFRKRQRSPEYRPARFLEHLDGLYGTLVGDFAMPPADLDLAKVLLALYPNDELSSVAQHVDDFVESKRVRLETLLAQRSPRRTEYLDSRDWLFNLPEVLALFERAEVAPYALADAFRDSDLEGAIRRTCVAYGVVLPE